MVYKKEIQKFYINQKEGVAIAETALEDMQEFEFRNQISGGTGDMDRKRGHGGVRTLGVGISAEFIHKGYVDLRGRKVGTPEELATIAQVFRDPRFETLRFIHVRDNVIVGHEGITSKLPAASAVFLNLPDEDSCKSSDEYLRKTKSAQVRFFMGMLDRMERLDSNGFFLLHNHCSGIDVKPSKDDMDITKMYARLLPGFLGHIIIDSNRFSFIDRYLYTEIHEMHFERDKLLEPSVPHTMLGVYIDSPKKLAGIAKAIQTDPEYSVVVYVSTKNLVRGIQEIPNGIFRHEKECVDFLRGRMTEFGSSNAFVVTNNEVVKKMSAELVGKGYLLDAVITDKSHSITTVRESGILPSTSGETKWMGRRIGRCTRVCEGNTDGYKSGRNTGCRKKVKQKSQEQVIAM